VATGRQIRLHALNMRSLRVAVRIIRQGIKQSNDRNEGILFAAAVQYLMPSGVAEAEKILKADAGDVFDPDDLIRAGIAPGMDVAGLSFEQITELGLTLNADNFASAFVSMFEGDLDVFMIESATNAGNAWIGTLNPQLGLNLRDRMSIEWLRDNGLNLAKGVADSMKPQLREALAQTIIDGDVSVANMKRALRESLTDWEGWRLERIARTEGNEAMSAGTLESFKASEVVEKKEWFNPDPQAEPCILNNGQVVKLGEFFRSGHSRSPAHPNCFPGYQIVSIRGNLIGTARRHYKGKLIRFQTAGNRTVSVTPNHPIATDHGWVAAGRLNKGSRVLCRISSEFPSSVCEAKDQHRESSIEDISRAFFKSRRVSTSEVPITAEDFHGDGIDGEVCIIRTDSSLFRHFNSDHTVKSFFEIGCGRFAKLPCFGSFAKFIKCSFRSANFIMRRLDLVFSGLFRHTFPLFRSCFAFASDSDSVSLEQSKDSRRNTAALFSQNRSRNSRNIIGYYAIGIGELDSSISHCSEIGSASLDESSNGAGTTTIFKSEFFRRFPGEIFLDHVIRIDEIEFSGHVYNLHTELGHYTADGVISSNCESSILPVLA